MFVKMLDSPEKGTLGGEQGYSRILSPADGSLCTVGRENLDILEADVELHDLVYFYTILIRLLASNHTWWD